MAGNGGDNLKSIQSENFESFSVNASQKRDEKRVIREKSGVKEGMNEKIQILLMAPVVKGEMTNELTVERDFKKASRLNRKRRLATIGHRKAKL
jgi:hypothetical protein